VNRAPFLGVVIDAPAATCFYYPSRARRRAFPEPPELEQSSRRFPFLLAIPFLLLLSVAADAADAPPLRWGGDKAGGAPFIYEEPGKGEVGFEVELARFLGEKIGRKPEFVQCDWDTIPDVLERGNIDVGLNGLEYRPEWEAKFPSTLPYFVYTLRLIVRDGNSDIRSWDDLRTPRDGKPRVGVLRGSFAERYMREKFGDDVEVIATKEVDETFQLVEEGVRMDATVQDSPAAVYYVQGGRRDKLKVVGPPAPAGYYVILTRPKDVELREQLNAAIKEALASGKLEAIYRKYGLWDKDQERLGDLHSQPWPPAGEAKKGLSLRDIADKIARAAWMTVKLACCSMPLAILIGMLVAVGRMYGPWPLRVILTGYVEVLRGTPLLLQMYVWFFLVPNLVRQLGGDELAQWFSAAPFYVGVFGLAINYSAAEAENYRAGLQAIPRGQMEAALALGMSPLTAIRRVMLPQAVRIVIPPVTNDFIALFKDTSICSMILITELTGLYYQYKYDRDLVLELALTIALIYLLISYPLSLLAGYLERRLEGGRENK
jgi:polar amino acid transport system permease protein/polar amino acid transport system substrate-binding protein